MTVIAAAPMLPLLPLVMPIADIMKLLSKALLRAKTHGPVTCGNEPTQEPDVERAHPAAFFLDSQPVYINIHNLEEHVHLGVFIRLRGPVLFIHPRGSHKILREKTPGSESMAVVMNRRRGPHDLICETNQGAGVLSVISFLIFGSCGSSLAQSDLAGKNILVLHAHEANAPVFLGTDKGLSNAFAPAGYPAGISFSSSWS